jgi:hypothetical protein
LDLVFFLDCVTFFAGVDLLAFGLEDFVTMTQLEDLAPIPEFEVLVLPLEIEVFVSEPETFPLED